MKKDSGCFPQTKEKLLDTQCILHPALIAVALSAALEKCSRDSLADSDLN